jgi:AcrR family transcriptional regulator
VEQRPAATTRILNAARELVARGGAAEVSMGDVAASAEVSKALVHYHFRDKESLMHALVDHVGLAVVAREREAVAAEESDHALDAYWRWLERELREGDVRILAALGEYDSARVRDAARGIARQRRELAAAHVGRLFEQLGLTPRVPPALMADTVVAFIDGLACACALEPERDPRPAFDVLWLAFLTLTEQP